jgi:hypothetical protein
VQYEDDMNCNIKVPKIKSKPVSKVRLPRIFRADRDLLDLAESLVGTSNNDVFFVGLIAGAARR